MIFNINQVVVICILTLFILYRSQGSSKGATTLSLGAVPKTVDMCYVDLLGQSKITGALVALLTFAKI